MLAQAVAERAAWNLHISNRGIDAAATLRQFLNTHQLTADVQAFLLQRVAWYLRKDDPAGSLETQTSARERDPQLLMPSSGVKYRKGPSSSPPNVDRFTEWLRQFDQINGAVAAIDSLRSHLTFAPDAPHEQFEQALCDLGALLGFESRRPDREVGEGPDVLWLHGQLAVPLEAKNRTSDDADSIAKHVAGQLMQAEAWTKLIYPERPQVVPVSVHPRAKCGAHAIMPAAARVLTPEALGGILDSILVVVAAVRQLDNGNSTAIVGKKLAEQKLDLATIINSRTVRPT